MSDLAIIWILGLVLVASGVAFIAQRHKYARRGHRPIMRGMNKSRWWWIPFTAGCLVLVGGLFVIFVADEAPPGIAFGVPGSLLMLYGTAMRTGKDVRPVTEGRPWVSVAIGTTFLVGGVAVIIAGLTIGP